MKQVVRNPTRLNPPRLLYPIITTLSDYYQEPVCLAPLDVDSGSNGEASDHLMVVMEPISQIDNKPARHKKTFLYRPFTEERLKQMQMWMQNEKWDEVTHEASAHKKMAILQNILLTKYFK